MISVDDPDCNRIVLVVDDDEGIRETLFDLLSDEGYTVVTAADGRQALDKLRQTDLKKPCVILLDLMMPIMSGSEFYQEQQRDPELAAIPVVVISADGSVGIKAQPFGGEYLTKPVRFENVLDMIARHCD